MSTDLAAPPTAPTPATAALPARARGESALDPVVPKTPTEETLAPSPPDAAHQPGSPHGARLWSGFGRAATRLLDVLLPRRCAHCAGDLGEDRRGPLLCSGCRHLLARPRPPACTRCGDHLPAGTPAGCCRRCRSEPPPYSSVTYLAAYEYELRDAVVSIKSACQEPLAVALVELLWELRRDELSQLQAEVVVPLPMHWARRLQRGANAPDVLAERLARRLGVPLCPMLARRRHTAPQASLARAARLTNLRQAFGLRGSYNCRGARVLLVDDVLTTGTTCGEATRVLLRHGAATVSVAVLARAEGRI